MQLPALWEKIVKHFYPGVQDAILISHVTILFTISGLIALKCSQPPKEAQDVFFRGIDCKELPCGRRLLCICDLEVILLYVI